MNTIYYRIKHTTANTDYLSIEPNDYELILTNVISILTYMSELSLTKDKQLRPFISNWWLKSNKKYLYNSKLKKHNSPLSYLAGTINNLQFGTQNDLSLLQLQTLQDIINDAIDVIDTIEEVTKIKLQSRRNFTKIWLTEASVVEFI